MILFYYNFSNKDNSLKDYLQISDIFAVLPFVDTNFQLATLIFTTRLDFQVFQSRKRSRTSGHSFMELVKKSLFLFVVCFSKVILLDRFISSLRPFVFQSIWVQNEATFWVWSSLLNFSNHDMNLLRYWSIVLSHLK